MSGLSPPTRANQLLLKGKVKKNKKLKKKGKKVRASGNKKIALSPSGRRRSVLKKRSKDSLCASKASLSEDAEGDLRKDDGGKLEPERDEKATVGRRGRKKSGAAKPANPKPKRAPKAKASPKKKASPKASAKAKAEAKAKAKAKATATPKAACKAKAKATGKAKASKKRSHEDEGSVLCMDMPKDLDGWVDVNARLLMVACAREFYDFRHDAMADFKLRMCEVLPEAARFQVALLNKYWTRSSCGVTIKESRKDICSFHLPHPTVTPNLRMCVTTLCALLLVPWL